MPPPMPNPSKRMTANPSRPVRRYRPGKAVAAEQSSSEEDPDEEEDQPEEQNQPPPKPQKRAPVGSTTQSRHGPSRPEPSKPAADDDDEEGFVTEEEVEDVAGLPARLAAEAGPTEVGGELRGENEDDDDDDDDDDEDGEGSEEDVDASSEEDSSSEDEPRRTFLRPTFIKKTDRKASGGAVGAGPALISGASSGIVIDEAGEQEEARRREMADLMIKDKLERDAAARLAGKKSWDDDDDEVVGEDVVDDTDDVDPDAELAAWKLRELKRLKRDREAIEAYERDVEERERRANLTPAEREAEDAERLARQKEEREEGRGKAGFMQRYHHKGAFFQDDETAEMLRKRDLMGAQYVDEVKNREALPEYMQIRNMEKLGKKGRTRYKDLRGEDTGQWGDYAKQDSRRFGGRDRGGGGGAGPDLRHVDERFQPDRDGGVRAGPTGANASAVRDRRKRSLSPSRDWEGDKRPRIEAT